MMAAQNAKMKISLGGLKKKSVSETGAAKGINAGVIPNAFGREEEEEDEDVSFKPSSSNKSKLNLVAGAAPASKSSKAREEEALSIDSSIFDYDSVYDQMKEGQRLIQTKNEKENKKRDPKYMSSSFAASEQRRIDRQRAEAKKIQREREQEGDLYQNTESFVTDAYKQQMEEIRKAEEDEKKSESFARQKNKGTASFYKDILSQQDRAHQAAVEASLRSASIQSSEAKEEVDDNDESRKKARIEEARQKGLDVRTNDENEVVDERSLLSAGLNTFSNQNKRQKTDSNTENRSANKNDTAEMHSNHSRHKVHGQYDARQAQRERQSRLIEEQMLALQSEREEEERKQEIERKKALIGQKRNDTNRIELARQRALERRKNKQEAKE